MRTPTQALGFASCKIFGTSCGTKLGQEARRSAPGGLRTVILDSVWSVQVLMCDPKGLPIAENTGSSFDPCAADTVCAAACADLEARVRTACESREAARDPTPPSGTMPELEALAQFIRQWLTANDRLGSSRAIAGAGCGGMRVVALTRVMAEQRAINLISAAMILPELNVYATFESCSLLFPMTRIARQTAVALVHGRGGFGADAAAMQAAGTPALTEYLTGLAAPDRMTPGEQTGAIRVLDRSLYRPELHPARALYGS